MIARISVVSMLCVLVVSCAHEGEPVWRSDPNGLYYYGIRIPTALSISVSSEDVEVRDFYRQIPATDPSVVLLKLLDSSGQLEVWLVNRRADDAPERVFSAPADMTVRWHGEKFYSVGRQSMGTSVHFFFRYDGLTGHSSELGKVVDFLAVDSQSGVIASLNMTNGPDQILFSRLASEETATAPIEFPVDHVSMVLESVSVAKIVGCVLELELRTPTDSAVPVYKQIAIPPPVCIN